MVGRVVNRAGKDESKCDYPIPEGRIEDNVYEGFDEIDAFQS
jgi:hypothetical protein